MRRILFFGMVIVLLTSCGTKQFCSIKHLTREFSATQNPSLVYSEPQGVYYMGKIKVVPRDGIVAFNKETALRALLQEAAKCGANYVYIKGVEVPNSNFNLIKWDMSWGDGVSIEAELYH